MTLRAGFERKDPVVTGGKHHSDMTIKLVKKFKSIAAVNVVIILIVELFKFELFISANF